MATVSGSSERSFTWLFLAVSRSNPEDKPHRVSVTAPDEQSARELLAGQYVLSFAGRIPARQDITQPQPVKVVLPYVKPLAPGDELTLEPLTWLLRKEQHFMMSLFKQALEAAGVAYIGGAAHE